MWESKMNGCVREYEISVHVIPKSSIYPMLFYHRANQGQVQPGHSGLCSPSIPWLWDARQTNHRSFAVLSSQISAEIFRNHHLRITYVSTRAMKWVTWEGVRRNNTLAIPTRDWSICSLLIPNTLIQCLQIVLYILSEKICERVS